MESTEIPVQDDALMFTPPQLTAEHGDRAYGRDGSGVESEEGERRVPGVEGGPTGDLR